MKMTKRVYPRDNSGVNKNKGDDRPMNMSTGHSRPAKPATVMEQGSAERKAHTSAGRITRS